MKYLFLIIISVSSFAVASAQPTEVSKREIRKQKINELIRQEEEGVIAYRKHNLFGLKLHSDGYGAFFEICRAQSVRKALLFQMEVNERKSRKEVKQQIFTTTTPLIYGKINFFYPVKLGVQQQYLLGNKSNKNGVSLFGSVGGGFIAGLLRPYLADVNKNGIRTFVGYESADSFYFLNGPYYGGPSFSAGWNKMKVTPGLYAKASLRFDYGRYNEIINGLEVGACAEFYSKKVPQMIYNDPKQFFASLYVSILFGRRK